MATGVRGDNAALRRAVVQNMARRVAAQRGGPAGVRDTDNPNKKARQLPDGPRQWPTRSLYSRNSSSYDNGTWYTPSGAPIATGEHEDSPKRPLYSNRKNPPR